jgi:DNA-binding NtrC family response regulator
MLPFVYVPRGGPGRPPLDVGAELLVYGRVDLRAILRTVERDAIQQTLRAAKGNQSRTARMLGIGRERLRRKMRTLEIT